MHIRIMLILTCCLAVTAQLTAAELTPTYRTVRGQVIIDDNFAGTEIPPHWKASKGTWLLVDGAIEGREKESDMHNGVLTTKQTYPAILVATVDIRFEGAKATSLVFNGPDGHICRVSINPKGFSVSGEKDKKNANDQAVNLGKIAQEFIPSQWYHFTIEIADDEILVYTDEKHIVYGKDAKIAREKNAFAITVTKESIRCDNILICAAETHTNWQDHKAKLGIK